MYQPKFICVLQRLLTGFKKSVEFAEIWWLIFRKSILFTQNLVLFRQKSILFIQNSMKKLKLIRSDFFQPTAEFLNTDCGDWFIPSKNLVETVSMRFMI
jgi:hypothetical protein